MKNICKNCGKEYEYEPKKGTYKSVYCSYECKTEFNKKDNLPQKRICQHCGKEYDWDPNVKFYGKLGNLVDTKKFCCYECGKAHKYAKVRETTIKNFGGIGYASKELLQRTQNTKLKKYGNLNNYEKIKQTCLERYGVEKVSKVIGDKISSGIKKAFEEKGNEIREKRKQTNLEKYGTEYISQAQIVKDKVKQTCLKRYGTENISQVNEVKEKRKQTCLKKYGVENYGQTKEHKEKVKQAYFSKTKDEINEIKEKTKQTCLKKYGTEYALTSPIIKEKIKQTNLEKYGKVNGFNYEKIKKTNLEKYGIMYTCLLEKCQVNNNMISKINLKFKEELDKLNISSSLEKRFPNYSYDLEVGTNLIEINPTFTHNSSKEVYKGKFKIKPKDIYYHQEKTLFANKNGYRCIHIWDWDDKNKIIEMLTNKEIIYARNLSIKEVSKKDTGLFLQRYHLQDSCNGQNVCLGLYKENELIEIMTFGKPRYNKKYEWELLRLCTKAEYKVVGGAEKLFKHFIKTYNPKSIISYCDNSKFTGEVYKRLGMTLKSFGQPSKHWYNPFTNRHITDNLLRQRGYSQLHNDKNHKKGESNEFLMLEDGYLEIYDCGQSTYIWYNTI